MNFAFYQLFSLLLLPLSSAASYSAEICEADFYSDLLGESPVSLDILPLKISSRSRNCTASDLKLLITSDNSLSSFLMRSKSCIIYARLFVSHILRVISADSSDDCNLHVKFVWMSRGLPLDVD